MRRLPPIAVAAALAVTLAAAPALAVLPSDVTLTAGPTSPVVSVSPDVYYDEGTSTYYLYTTGMRIGVYSSRDGQSWAEVPGAATPSGPYFDPTVVKVGESQYRMYYVYRAGTGNQPCSGKELRYATSTDLIRWTPQPRTLLSDLGCGVPNVVVIDTGLEYRLYYVRGGEGLVHGTYMATSPDGLTWTPTDTLLTPKDFVDPSVVQLSDGSWLMFTADFPAGKSSGPFFQRLYVGTSEDGLAWDFDATDSLYAAPAGQGAFDPDAVVLPDGSVRLWWAQGADPMVATVTPGTVTLAPTPDPDPEPAPLPVEPGKPTVTTSKAGIKVSWTYPIGAPSPDGYRVQVRTSKAWKDVATVASMSASVPWSRVGAKKGRAFSVRVIAYIDGGMATSAATRATRSR